MTLSAVPSAALMGALLLLFVARVGGQILAATIRPAWLPPMARWYSGLMPYRYLLPTQIVFIGVMATAVAQVARKTAPLGAGSPAVGTTMIWASYVYAAGMTVRAVRYALAPPDRRGVLIPIIFHFVLAAFLFVWGTALAR